MRISLSMFFGLLVALGVFLAVQSLLVENQFRSATNQSFQGSGLVSFNNSTQNIQVRNSGKPQKPTAFNEPPLPPVAVVSGTAANDRTRACGCGFVPPG